MKIVLISVFPDLNSYGLRSISACLKCAGHNVDMYFIPRSLHGASVSGYPYSGYASVQLSEETTKEVLDELVSVTKDAGLIGISVMSNFLDEVIQITQRLKQAGRGPIIWGGIHPTVDPERSLDYADMICVGEGEEAVQELVDNMEHDKPLDKVRNIWIKENGELIKNKIYPLIQNLDSIPFQDFDCKSHYILTDSGFQKMTLDLMKFHLKNAMFEQETYMTMPSRGCCYSCNYCCNNHLNKMYKGQKIVRKRSVEHIIDELRQVKNRFPFIKKIQFEDDAFSYVFTKSEVKDFANKYKSNIGLELFVTGIAPATIDRDKFASLIDAGMTSVRLGVQTGSSRTLELYNRKQTNEQVQAAAELINEYKDKIHYVQYDIILDNPWESEDDLIETLICLNGLPAPFLICLQSLTFFPGTELYLRAKTEGGIKDEFEDIFRKHFSRPQNTYINKLFLWMRASKARGYMAQFVGNIGGKDISMWKLYLLKSAFIRWCHKQWVCCIYFILFILHGFKRLFHRVLWKE